MDFRILGPLEVEREGGIVPEAGGSNGPSSSSSC